MLEALIALAALAGNTVVAAATTDAWEALRRKFAQLLGRGDPDRTKVAERRLDTTRDQLTDVAPVEREKVQAILAGQWETRFVDLLTDHPDARAELEALVSEIRAMLPPGVVSASGQSLAAGGDIKIQADRESIAAGGNVTLSGPTPPGPAAG